MTLKSKAAKPELPKRSRRCIILNGFNYHHHRSEVSFVVSDTCVLDSATLDKKIVLYFSVLLVRKLDLKMLTDSGRFCFSGKREYYG